MGACPGARVGKVGERPAEAKHPHPEPTASQDVVTSILQLQELDSAATTIHQEVDAS